jgi:hypothetical protein
MRWSQKLYGVSKHLEKLEQRSDTGFVIEPGEFLVDDDDIRESQSYFGRIKHMAIMSEDYSRKVGAGVFKHKHRGSEKFIMQGKVEKKVGLIFEQDDDVWSCKLPNRAAFSKWQQCQTKNANRLMQRFVMFYVAREGAAYPEYAKYPFDQFCDINDGDQLAVFLNDLADKS